MRVQVVLKLDTGWSTFEYPDEATAEAALLELGFPKNGESRSWENADPRSAVPRKELWNRTTYSHLCGPMWGGEGTLRYENWAAYDRLST